MHCVVTVLELQATGLDEKCHCFHEKDASQPSSASAPGHPQHRVGDLSTETFRDIDTQRETKKDIKGARRTRGG